MCPQWVSEQRSGPAACNAAWHRGWGSKAESLQAGAPFCLCGASLVLQRSFHVEKTPAPAWCPHGVQGRSSRAVLQRSVLLGCGGCSAQSLRGWRGSGGALSLAVLTITNIFFSVLSAS